MSTEQQAKSEQSTALVPSGGDMIVQQRDQAAFVSIFGNLLNRELHNFDGDQRRQWQLKAMCASAAAEPLESVAGQPLNIVYYYGMLYEHVDEKTGEIDDRLRFVLVTDDMKAYRTASPYVAREIGRAVATFGNKPFDPPLRIRMVKCRGNGGREFFTIEPVID